MSLLSIPLPKRIENALHDRQQLESAGIYFAPIRHHSPACAYSTLSLIEQIEPDYVLIEGPDSFNGLLASLLHHDTQPPVAIMAQTEVKPAQVGDKSDVVTRSAYFPFCEYSPEWQALQIGQQHQAQLRFIDLPWTAQVNEDEANELQSQSLQKERYLAHSLFISQLAKKVVAVTMMNYGSKFLNYGRLNNSRIGRHFSWIALFGVHWHGLIMSPKSLKQKALYSVSAICKRISRPLKPSTHKLKLWW